MLFNYLTILPKYTPTKSRGITISLVEIVVRITDYTVDSVYRPKSMH